MERKQRYNSLKQNEIITGMSISYDMSWPNIAYSLGSNTKQGSIELGEVEYEFPEDEEEEAKNREEENKNEAPKENEDDWPWGFREEENGDKTVYVANSADGSQSVGLPSDFLSSNYEFVNFREDFSGALLETNKPTRKINVSPTATKPEIPNLDDMDEEQLKRFIENQKLFGL